MFGVYVSVCCGNAGAGEFESVRAENVGVEEACDRAYECVFSDPDGGRMTFGYLTLSRLAVCVWRACMIALAVHSALT